MIQWYGPELEVLEASPLVTLRIYVTRHSVSSSPVTPISRLSIGTLPDVEKSTPPSALNIAPESPSQSDSDNYDIEKRPQIRSQSSDLSTMTNPGRPKISELVAEILEKSDVNDRIVVTTCGPDSLMQTTRRVVAGCIRPDGPSIELHCEQFGF